MILLVEEEDVNGGCSILNKLTCKLLQHHFFHPLYREQLSVFFFFFTNLGGYSLLVG